MIHVRIFTICVVLVAVKARNHTLQLVDEPRDYIDISTFGYLRGGHLFVNATGLAKNDGLVGFTLEKADGKSTYVEKHERSCQLENIQEDEQNITFLYDFERKLLSITRKGENLVNITVKIGTESCSGEWHTSTSTPSGTGSTKNTGTAGTHDIGAGGTLDTGKGGAQKGNKDTPGENQEDDEIENKGDVEDTEIQTNVDDKGETGSQNMARRKRSSEIGDAGVHVTNQEGATSGQKKDTKKHLLHHLPLTVNEEEEYQVSRTLARSFNQFLVCMNNPQEEGLYNLYFYSCHKNKFDLTVHVVEQSRENNYLSAGELGLPGVYAFMSFVFLGTAIFWIVYLCKHEETVFKIHYLMFMLVILKSLSLMFHSLDYHYIAVKGSPMQTFAVLFYITYLIKGALLFSTIALVGSGLAFIKPILSEKDKKLFFAVIPLQVLANTAYIVTETTEEGDSQYKTWRATFFLVDILCCVAILYPVKWSIQHLQSSSSTDGKAAISLLKLRLFKQFYTMVVCYIYFTRIIVAVLKSGLSFRYVWVHEIFFEGATMAFFVVTAYKFRPGSDNPYLRLPEEDDYDDEDDDQELEDVIMNSGHAETLKKHTHNSTKQVQRDDSQVA